MNYVALYVCPECPTTGGPGMCGDAHEPREMRAVCIRSRVRDGETIWQLRCPFCGLLGDLDDDQLHGRVSIDCPRCDFHQTHDLAAQQGEQDG
jgi:uncharacterized C2H2 Zn-finger protein